MDSEHALRVQLAAALKERDEAKARADRAESSALDNVRQYVEALPVCTRAGVLRILDDMIPPAAAPAAVAPEKCHLGPDHVRHDARCGGEPAAPAAEPDVCVGSERIGGYLVPKYAPAAVTGKAQAWAAAIEYCEEMFSPEWLADPRNRSIFAAHIYRLLTAARAAPPEGEGT